jgi:hypothetical protein
LVVGVEAEAAGVELGVCAATAATHTNTPSSNAKQTNLRNPTTSFYYRRKLLPRSETSSSARLRISS